MRAMALRFPKIVKRAKGFVPVLTDRRAACEGRARLALRAAQPARTGMVSGSPQIPSSIWPTTS